MLALAEFVMRGRMQAILAAVFLIALPVFGSSLIFWISGAIVALVTLRRGPAEGAMVCLWTLLPLMATVWFGNPVPFATMVLAFGLAVLLRSTGSWPLVLSCAAFLGAVVALVLLNADGYMQRTLGVYVEVMEKLKPQLEPLYKNMGMPADTVQTLMAPRLIEFVGSFGLRTTLFSCLALLLARYWQASLYNPGGFKQEFHALRFPPYLLAVLLVATAVCWSSDGMRTWSGIFALPLLFAGLGFLHYLASLQHAGKGLLVIVYSLLLLALQPMLMVLGMIAVVDSFADLRRRLGKVPPGPSA